MNGEKVKRLIDANINRISEGVRVVEDICRFVLDDAALTVSLKEIRHRVRQSVKEWKYDPAVLGESRSVGTDVGRDVNLPSETQRDNLAGIASANLKRVQEGMRVLEEFSKLDNSEIASGFQEMRYRLYELEKDILKKVKNFTC